MSTPAAPIRVVSVPAVLLAALLGGACVAVGFWLGRPMSSYAVEHVGLSPEPIKAEGSTALIDEIRALHEAIERLAASRSERSTAGVPSSSTGDLADLRRSIDELKNTNGRALTSPSTLSATRTGSPRSDLLSRLAREIFAIPKGSDDDSAASESRSRWFSDKSAALTQSHLLWTVDDLVSAYGRPTTASQHNAGIYMEYVTNISDTMALYVSFVLAIDRVVEVQVWENELPK